MFTIEPARPEERREAFRLVFNYLPEEERGARVATALSLVSTGDLEPAGIFVARSAGELRGALVATPLRGAGGLVWPPFVREGADRQAQEDQLTQSACAWLRRQGAKLAQAILSPAERFLAVPLERNGFAHVTRLQYMRHDLRYPSSGPQRGAIFRTYPQAERRLFLDTLLRTYEGTLDCPELNGIRTSEEIVEGHQAQGVFHPERWWLACEGNQPVGVLLTSGVPEWDSWDISYVGVVPEARRRGWGRAMTQLALCAASTAGASRVTLAVDARNQPAWNLYRGLGFEPGDQREVYLKFFPAPCRREQQVSR